MGSRTGAAFIAGGLIFSEETTEDILDHRAELMEEIEGLQEEIHGLYDIKNVPKHIELCKAELIALELKRKCMESEIVSLYEEKKEQMTHNIEEEAKRFKDRNEKYKKTEEKLKGEIKALHVEKIDIEESITLKEAAIDVIDNDIIQAEKERDETLEETSLLHGNVEEAQKIIENEKKTLKEALLDLNNKRKTFKEEVERFAEDNRGQAKHLAESLDRIEKKEIELDLRIEQENVHIETKKTEFEVLKKNTEAKSEGMEADRAELRAWREALDKREEVITKREEDLDTNWTLFERERGKK